MVTIEPQSGVLGATLTGLDLTELDSRGFNSLQEALDKYLVVKVPGQVLDRFALSDLAARFGKHFIHPIVTNGYDDCPEVLEIYRKPDDQTVFGGESWHADVTWLKPAGYVSILHAIDVPAVGGDTAFASTIAAFESLSSGLQKQLRHLHTRHAYHWYERREQSPWVTDQPAVRRHDKQGREGLYLNRMFSTRFCGMTEAESAPLLAYLFDRLEQHTYTCRFRWQAGDVVLWDNRFTLHYPINDYSGQPRRMIRTTVLES